MTNEEKKFSKKWIWLGGIAFAVTFLIITWNNLVTLEQRLPALHTKSQNSLSTMINSIKSQGMVVGDFEKTFLTSIEKVFGENGRYGSGMGGLFKAIGESNPNLPPDVYTKLQATIGAEYKSFEAAQNEKIDGVRALKTALAQIQNQPARLLGGFPHIKIEDYEGIIMSGAAKEAFGTGLLDPVDPRSNR